MPRDLFISHASEDKAGFVEPLVVALRERGVTVWYDRFELKLGDDLRQKVDEGLRECRYGVVVLSPAFLGKWWPEAELSALLGLEKDGRKRILPVRHRLGHAELAARSPLLGGRLTTGDELGLDTIVEQIIAAIGHGPSRPAVELAVLRGQPPPPNSERRRVYYLAVSATLTLSAAVAYYLASTDLPESALAFAPPGGQSASAASSLSGSEREDVLRAAPAARGTKADAGTPSKSAPPPGSDSVSQSDTSTPLNHPTPRDLTPPSAPVARITVPLAARAAYDLALDNETWDGDITDVDVGEHSLSASTNCTKAKRVFQVVYPGDPPPPDSIVAGSPDYVYIEPPGRRLGVRVSLPPLGPDWRWSNVEAFVGDQRVSLSDDGTGALFDPGCGSHEVWVSGSANSRRFVGWTPAVSDRIVVQVTDGAIPNVYLTLPFPL